MNKHFIAGLLALTLAAPVWAESALPTIEAVQTQVQQGHYDQAQRMMQEVLAARPKSARAHYVYAEILAHNARFDEARKELRAAREIDPELKFTQSDKAAAFQQLLDREQRREAGAGAEKAAERTPMTNAAQTPVSRPQASSQFEVPGWLWIALLAVGGLMVWRLFASRRAPVASPAYGGGGYGGAAYGPNGYGAPMGSGGRGSGLLGAGLAAAGGVAAGMMLEKALDGRHAQDDTAGGNAMYDPSALDNPAQDLTRRDIDFGSGNDWGGDGGGDLGGGGGSSDEW